jgi:hypothetical protein
MNSLECARSKIRRIIAGSKVPEDPAHAENTVVWLLRLDPHADQFLQLAALAHDVERADEVTKVRRGAFVDYDAYKAAHASHSAEIVRRILEDCGASVVEVKEVCGPVRLHEVGGEPRSDVLKEADAISFFDTNLHMYHQREGLSETVRRSAWGYRRLSARGRDAVVGLAERDPLLRRVLSQIPPHG